MAWSGWSLEGSCQLDKGDHITWGDFHGASDVVTLFSRRQLNLERDAELLPSPLATRVKRLIGCRLPPPQSPSSWSQSKGPGTVLMIGYMLLRDLSVNAQI